MFDYHTDPSLATLILRPNASASSLPLNQLVTNADWATLYDSPPKPKITLPISESQNTSLTLPI
jgi:hypothetical protein